MKLLVLGGTVFLGRHIVQSALSLGHDVSIFTRGQHNPNLFPGVEKLVGDREADLSALQGRSWDACIDTSAYIPRVARSSAQLLANSVEHYTFVSTISVYSDTSKPGTNEEAPLGTLEDESVEEVTGDTYGPLKVLCERAVEQSMPGRVLIIRPGLIVGPYDPTDRFTYWPVRVERGGPVLAPGNPQEPIQCIDVRDLAEWTLRMVEQKQVGVFNATGPDYTLTMKHFLDCCVAVSGSGATLTWLTDQFLLQHDTGPWMELPLWLGDEEESAGFSSIDCRRAITNGLKFRPLDETIRATLDWHRTRDEDHEWRAGMKPERERELLKEWSETAL